MTYEFTNADLPAIFNDQTPKRRVRDVQRRILAMAAEMNLPLSFAEVEKFGLLLVAILDEKKEQ